MVLRKRSVLLFVCVLLTALFAAACSLNPGGVSDSAVLAASKVRGSSAPSLGTASSFVVLGGPAVTLTDSVVTGDVGTLGAYTATNSSIVDGMLYQGDAAQPAYDDFLAAYDALGKITPTTALPASLAGVTLKPGVYYSEAATTSTGGVLTLNGGPKDVWIFLIGTKGTGALTGTNFSVDMTGGADPCNVYWWVAEGVTMTDSDLVGTILAGADITFTRGTFEGRAFGKQAVTVNTMTAFDVCDTAAPGPEPKPAHDKKLKAKPFVYDPDRTGIIVSRWMPHTGLPDAGKSDHGLVVQKNGPTATNAAAGAVIKGADGEVLTELGFDFLGYAGAGSPRFNVTVGGTTYFFGSVYGIHTDLGGGWTRVRFSGSEPGAGGFGGVIEAIAILVDEEGQSVLDNIDVNGTLIGKPGNAR